MPRTTAEPDATHVNFRITPKFRGELAELRDLLRSPSGERPNGGAAIREAVSIALPVLRKKSRKNRDSQDDSS